MVKLGTLFKSMYMKILFSAVLIFGGITSGIYVGYALVDNQPIHSEQKVSYGSDRGIDLDEQYVNFDQGDLFPLETYVDRNNNIGYFENLIKDKPTIFLFVSLNCGPCHDMLRYWNLNIQDKLKKNVQVIVCIRKEDGKIPEEFSGLLKGKQLILFDGNFWSLKYDMDFWPTIIAVDESGFVRKVQLGFENYIHYDIANYFFRSKKS